MTYDLYWRRTAQEKDPAASSDFHLSISGMSSFVRFMHRHGMVFDDLPVPRWPNSAHFGVTDEQAWAAAHPEDDEAAFAALTPALLDKANAYNAATDAVLSWHGRTDVPGIPLHKFRTNDGWIVLPVECRAAVEIWQKAGRPVPPKRDGGTYWHDWIAFLDGAAEHDGFEVW